MAAIVILAVACVSETQLRTGAIRLFEEPDHEVKINIAEISMVQLTELPSVSAEEGHSKEMELTFKTITGQVEAYLAPVGGYKVTGSALTSEELTQTEKQGDQVHKKWKNSFLKIEEGLSHIDLDQLQELLAYYNPTPKRAKPEEEKQQLQQAIEWVLVIIPTMQSEVVVKIGQPHHAIELISPGRNFTVDLEEQSVHGRVFKVEASEDYAIRFVRESGFPAISILACTGISQIDCIYQPRRVPRVEPEPWESHSLVLFGLERMMSQEEEFRGQYCAECHVFILIQSYEGPASVRMGVKKLSSATELRENEVKKGYLPAQAAQDYAIWVKYNEKGFISIKVYEGELTVRVEDQSSGFRDQPQQTSGVIPIEIPIADENEAEGIREIHLKVAALARDTSFSILYSSGEYEVYLTDGETISQEIQSLQTISYYYLNERVDKGSLYFSLNVNEPPALKQLNMSIYYFEEIEGVSLKTEYVPSKPLLDLEDAKSLVFEIPGHYPKFLFKFQNGWEKKVSVDITINDEEVIFLPLSHPLPLQIEKDSAVNLLVKNNEQGFIELAIKKCDDSNPSLAYSLDSSDFLNQIYDYESVGESERIIRNNIKVRKGKGLYVRISGDGLTSSFIEIMAKYTELDRKKFEVSKLQKGDHGNIKYQLLTDSKAEITFTGLECGDKCRESTLYECVWSSSRADLYRQLICPSSFVIGSRKSLAHTGSYKIGIKPAHSDNQVSFKHIMADNILYMSVKATHLPSKTEFYYKDIEIVTIEGQLSRLSGDFKKKIVLAVAVAAGLLLMWVRSRSRKGYEPIKPHSEIRVPARQVISEGV